MIRLRQWTPTLSMMLVSLVSYLDRHTLAILSPTILADCQLSAEQYGWIISAFSIAYMVGNPLWGRWLDRYGVRWGMIAAVSIWTVASASHAFLSTFAGFVAARMLLGFGEGATFPGGLRTVVETLPVPARARGTAIAYSGGALGAILTPIIVTPIYRAHGWRAAFWFTGFVGLMWIASWLRTGRNVQGRRAAGSRPVVPLRWRDVRLWSFLASYALGGLPLGFVLYQSALYFHRALGKTQVEIGYVMWIPALGWELGYFTWGWIADRFRSAGSDGLSIYRRLTVTTLILVLPLALAPSAGSFPQVLALLSLAMYVCGGHIITAVGYATRVFGSGPAGVIAGLGAGSWSAVVALTMPVFGHLLDQRRYHAAFGLAAAISATGLLLWLWVNRRPFEQGDLGGENVL